MRVHDTSAPPPQSSGGQSGTIADVIAEFGIGLPADRIPAAVVDRAKLLMLDGLGVGFASGTFEFAARSKAALTALASGAGTSTVIGSDLRLPLRDAAHLNGILVHGLDYDDTHPGGVVHATASALPTALAVGEQFGSPGRDVVAAYVVGVEIAARLGAASHGRFHDAGFHPTGVVAAFSSAVLASRLFGLSPQEAATAQGFAGSLAAGSLEFLETGAWTKRSHPGWAALCGITAAAFAAQDFESPPAVYEGRFGFYATHLGLEQTDLSRCTEGLGRRWETLQVAVKPYPACHFTHAFLDAALRLREQVEVADIDKVACLIAAGEVGTVCEPSAAKRRPRSAYDAAFSLPYLVATAFLRGRVGLAELDTECRDARDIIALTDRVGYEIDPDSAYPDAFSGEVVVRTSDGRELRHREHVNRGAAERALTVAEIRDKFVANATLAIPAARAETIAEAVLALDEIDDVRAVAALLAGT